MTSLVVQTSFIGDMVLTTPLIAELARRGPVDVLTTPITAPLLDNNPDVRRVILYDKRGADRGPVGLWRAARSTRELFEEGRKRPVTYDVAYLAQGSVRSAIAARLVGAKEYVGFSTSAGRALYTRAVPYREERHHAERLWSLCTWDARGTEAPSTLRPSLYPGEQERAAVDAVLELAGPALAADGGSRLSRTAHQPLVVLAPGSTWATKRWPHFADLARLLAPQFLVALIGGESENEAASTIQHQSNVDLLDATGVLSLLGSAELIRRAAVLVTNDSAPLHLASAMNTPTVAVFGPTVPAFGFGPLARRSSVAGLDTLPCRPCHRHGPRRCPLGHWRCMRDLSAEYVAGLVKAASDRLANSQ
ncbi:MAG TPA: glycosyltransferase family 9 protein [Gemmatimonadaceae bacterium]|nr:glycosyltransferase family 9 protein [Gemmatimonadaceae bacterium]